MDIINNIKGNGGLMIIDSKLIIENIIAAYKKAIGKKIEAKNL